MLDKNHRRFQHEVLSFFDRPLVFGPSVPVAAVK